MVKWGPKLPSPTRRQLDRIEKENKRIAQIESGVVPALLGEPRENLMYLPPPGKKRRFKRAEAATIGESQRKRAKKQKRALARRNAKNMVKEAIARLTTGSPAKVAGSEGASTEDDGLGMLASGGILTTGSPIAEVPIAIIHTPLLTGSGSGSGVEADSSHPTPGWSFLKSVTRSWRSAKTMDQDVGLGLSPGIPALDLGQYSGDNSNTLVTSTPRIDVKGTSGTESRSFFDNESFVSGPSKKTDVTRGSEVNKGNYSPGRHQAPLPSRNVLPVSVHHFGRGSEPPARFSFRAPSRTSAGSQTAIFSEPLDYSNFSSKRSSSAYSSVRSQSQMVHRRIAEQPVTETSGLPDVLPATSHTSQPGPSSLIDSRLPEANLTQPPMPVSSGAGVTSKAPGATALKLGGAPGKVCAGGPSTINLGLEIPVVVAGASSPPVLPFPSAVAVKDGLCASDPLIGSHVPVSDHVHPPAGNPAKIMAPVRMEGSRTRELPSLGHNLTAAVTHLVTPNHARACEQNSGQIVNSASFSSNISSVAGSVQATAHGPAESLDANGLGANASAEMSVSHMLNFSASPNLTLRPLAPAAPIIHKTSRTRIVADRDITLPRSVILSDLQKRPYDGDLNAQSAREAERPSPFSWPTLNIRPLDDLTLCPDTPLLGSLSGIVPPTSTPTSRSPRIFAIALPTPWSRAPILPTHGPHIGDSKANGGREAGGVKGFVLALKWALRKTMEYFWQRRE